MEARSRFHQTIQNVEKAMTESFEQTDINRVRRIPRKARYDKETIYRIIDEALICHVGIVENGQPFVIPTNHARHEDKLYLHGASTSRLLKHIRDGSPVSVAITLLEGIVFARAAFEHSLHYRSVVLFGHGRRIENDEEKLFALQVLTDHIADGRWDDARKPNAKELAATTVVEVFIESASAKVSDGFPGDTEEDYDLPIWAGVLPYRLQALDPIEDPRLHEHASVPAYVSSYRRK